MDRIKNALFKDGSTMEFVKFPKELNHIKSIYSKDFAIINTDYAYSENELTKVSAVINGHFTSKESEAK